MPLRHREKRKEKIKGEMEISRDEEIFELLSLLSLLSPNFQFLHTFKYVPNKTGADRNRTDGLLSAIQALSQLSYSPGISIITKYAIFRNTAVNIFFRPPHISVLNKEDRIRMTRIYMILIRVRVQNFEPVRELRHIIF